MLLNVSIWVIRLAITFNYCYFIQNFNAFMERFFRIFYYTAFTVFVLSCILVIFSIVVSAIAFLYWSLTLVLQYILRIL